MMRHSTALRPKRPQREHDSMPPPTTPPRKAAEARLPWWGEMESLGVTLFRESFGGAGGAIVARGGPVAPIPCIDVREQDFRRQTTVRLFMSRPEASI